MVTQKTQASMNAKGFTLVELIVVITILVILGTIAFLNLGGMSASARDSQRTSDLNQINQQVMVAQAKSGISYKDMVSTNAANKLAAADIGGAAAATDYEAGDVSYTVLGVDRTKFQDPISSDAYKMGATGLAGSAYQLAASLEESKTALVMGSYRARTDATITVASAVGSIVTLTSGLGTFKLNDTVEGDVGSGTITGISADLKRITLNNTTMSGATTLALQTSESTGLIASVDSAGAVTTTPVTNGGTALPYNHD